MRNWINKLFSAQKDVGIAPAASVPAVAGALPVITADKNATFKEQGDRHLREGAMEAATDCYRHALAVDPHNTNVLCSLGFALKEQGLTADAVQAFTQALAIDPTSVDAHYFLGSLHQASGNTDLAETHFRQALSLAPDFEFAYRDFCFLLFQLGRLDQATQLAMRGIARIPESADLHFFLGNLYHAQQQLDLAVASFRRSLSIQAARPEVLANLGHVLLAQGNADQAIDVFQRVLSFNPGSVDAHVNLGSALRSLGKFDSALTSYKRALEIDPDLAIAHLCVGTVLQDLEQFDEAMHHYRRALEIKPSLVEAHVNLGVILQHLGKPDEAAINYRQALAIRPNIARAHNKLGGALLELGKIDDAINCYRKAVQVDPDDAEAHFNLGTVLNDRHQLYDAENSFRHALRINPDYVEAHVNFASVLTDLGRFDEAIANYRRALQLKPHFFEVRSNVLFISNYMPDQVSTNLLDEAIAFGKLAAQQAKPYIDWANTPVASRRLRIGMVSGDFRHHPVGFFIEGILKELTSNNDNMLDFIAYSAYSREDYLTERIKVFFHDWHRIADYSTEDLAKKIHDDGIDILIDLAGHTANNRLPMFAWKPAPIQVSWLGYFATTGVSAIDYFIADPWTLPASEESHFVEKIWRLPETRLSLTIPDVDVDVSPLPCLANGYITFGCFNNLSKLTEPMVALWGRILRATPESRLFLKAMQFADPGVQDNVRSRFAAHGIEESRILMEGFSTRPNYLSAYHRVDFALDTFPFTGGTTSAEGLWMGVPVLTLAGENLISRQGAGLVMNAGLADWIAIDADDYVAKAVRHAEDRQGLAALREKLRGRVLSSPIFDTRRFARNFDSALRGMWTQWCDAQQRRSP